MENAVILATETRCVSFESQITLNSLNRLESPGQIRKHCCRKLMLPIYVSLFVQVPPGTLSQKHYASYICFPVCSDTSGNIVSETLCFAYMFSCLFRYLREYCCRKLMLPIYVSLLFRYLGKNCRRSIVLLKHYVFQTNSVEFLLRKKCFVVCSHPWPRSRQEALGTRLATTETTIRDNLVPRLSSLRSRSRA